jgi:hypothetical protein
MEVVGGILLDGVPELWVATHNLSLQRITAEFTKGAFPKTPSENHSGGMIAPSSAKTGVEFTETFFMSSAPAEGGSVQRGAPPFFFYLSPLSGATWKEPTNALPGKSSLPQLEQMVVTVVVPDLYAYRCLDSTGKAVWTRRPFFVVTKPHTLSRNDLLRIEEVELPDRAQVVKGVFLRKVVIALQGLQGADEFPDKVGRPLGLAYSNDLADAQQWFVEDGEGKRSRLLKQDVDSSGSAIVVFENGISLPVETLLKALR